MTFDEFFSQATGNPEPYPYQRRFAIGDSIPQVLSVPTGVGKTATAVLGWLWRRRFADGEVRNATPRRLVFCLPMRTLVEQTRDECTKWLSNLELENDVGVHVLMGGEDGSVWDAHPERDAIIIGTQDMLLSRALNRGYGMSRYRWPMHFGFLNNDCLWVLDETQLMGVGLTTSVQLAGLRSKLNTYATCQTLWMSATLENEALETVDHPMPDPNADGVTLEAADFENSRVQRLITAAKPITSGDVSLSKDTQKAYEKQLAESVCTAHVEGSLSLVVVNSVERSQKLFQAVQKRAATLDPTPDIALIHSRFRAGDRHATQTAALNEETIAPAGRILIATQAIEAGVDISATTLFTELAPWASMVQRFGRCNRRGTCGENDQPAATVYWIDIDTADGKTSKFTLPYEPDVLDTARTAVSSLNDVGPQSLAQIGVKQERPVVHVLRRKDLVDLFDTTPDLSGKDLDVSRYIRDGDDNDVQFYWREWDLDKSSGRPPSNNTTDAGSNFAAAERDELCSVSVGKAKDFVSKLKPPSRAWAWDTLERTWASISKGEVRPGMTILLHLSAGGYDSSLGWTADARHKPVSLSHDESQQHQESMADDDIIGGGAPLSLTQHLKDVVHFAEELGAHVFDEQIPWLSVLAAARWHDVGKAHPAFQTAMRDFASIAEHSDCDTTQWAKAGERGRPDYRVEVPILSRDESKMAFQGHWSGRDDSVSPAMEGDRTHVTVEESVEFEHRVWIERRYGFRHELASALAWLQHRATAEDSSDDYELTDLVAFLIAAHHGKVRLSIRSMPNENTPQDRSVKFARGVWEGDRIPAVELDDGTHSTAVENLSLDLMSLGESPSGPSWLARMIELRDSREFGPFRLAFLESLVRIADWRGSANPGTGE